MVYEWDEEVPQPKPPTNRVRLAVETHGCWGGKPADWGDSRPATQADIARALGVTEAHLKDFLAGRLVKLAGSELANALGQQSQGQPYAMNWGHLGPCPPGCSCSLSRQGIK